MVSRDLRSRPLVDPLHAAAAFRVFASDGVNPFGTIVPALLGLWLAGVTLLTLRLLTCWIWMQRMRTHGVRPVEPV